MRIKSRAPIAPQVEQGQEPAVPVWMSRLTRGLPSFTDEVFAFLLIAIGLLSFLTLLSPSSGQIGGAWSHVLRQIFGIGAFVVSAAFMAAGALILLPKLGTGVRLNWWRFAGGELVFAFTLAYIHALLRASLGPVEAYARATEGRGGGLVGWAIQDLVHMLLGDVITGIVLLLILSLSTLVMLGVRRQSILDRLEQTRQILHGLAARIQPEAVDQQDPANNIPIEIVPQEPATPEPNTLTGGRPSIVTGDRGQGPQITPAPNPDSGGSPLALEHRTLREQLLESEEEIEIRFKLDRRPDKKKVGRRSNKLPPLDLLDDRDFQRPPDREININSHIIERTVEDFGMTVRVVGVKAGPTVTQYAVQPFTKVDRNGQDFIQRVRVTRVAALANDLSLALAARSVRIQAPVPGTNYIGVEVPNPAPGIVALRPVLESEQYFKIKSSLALGLGREVDGAPFAADLAKMPHLLIGGTTGSGKSVCLRSIATCLIANNRPDQLKLVMIDPKMVELIRFNGLPHLLGRVEVQLDRVIGVLRWVVREMDRRYRLMEEAQARNILTYNMSAKPSQRMPYIVVLIDELAELMGEYPDQTEHLITRLAQMARATGIHLVVATQRPSTDVVTGLIKANFPARIAFAVASSTDSRVIIDSVGAEDLIGKGDMLFLNSDAAGPIRLQGSFVSDIEMERLVDYWRDNWEFDDTELPPWEASLTRAAIIEATDPMLIQAAAIVQEDRVASASLLQRKLNVGYPRAGRIIDSLFRLGVVGPEQSGGRLREVLIPEDADPSEFIVEQQMKRRGGT